MLTMVYRFVKLLGLCFLQLGCTSLAKFIDPTSTFCPPTPHIEHLHFGSPASDNLVIFVHGFCGNAKSTWLNPETQFHFPEELARDLDDSHIISFSYASQLEGGPSVLGIADHLEFEIGEMIKTHKYRTLRFVAHSMGGLVVREYLLRRQPRSHPQLRVTNVILLGTPNNGTELAELSWLVPHSRQVQELRHIDRGNTFLESLNKDWNREFKALGHPRYLLLYAGYEEIPLRFTGKSVHLSSAIAYADDSIGFQANHIDIAKPKDIHDPIYRWVKSHLQESIDSHLERLVQALEQQGLITAPILDQAKPRITELLLQLQDLSNTDLKDVLALVRTGKLDQALSRLAQSESTETLTIDQIAYRYVVRAQINELKFSTETASQYYLQAIQLTPQNAYYRLTYAKFLILTGKGSQAIEQLEEALHLAKTLSDANLEAAIQQNLSVAYEYLSRYQEGIQIGINALQNYEKAMNLQGKAAVLTNLGILYQHTGTYQRAIEMHEDAIAIFRSLGDRYGEAGALTNLGAVLNFSEKYQKGIEYHRAALHIFEELHNLRGEGDALAGLGNGYSKLGQYDKAIESYSQSHQIPSNKRPS